MNPEAIQSLAEEVTYGLTFSDMPGLLVLACLAGWLVLLYRDCLAGNSIIR